MSTQRWGTTATAPWWRWSWTPSAPMWGSWRRWPAATAPRWGWSIGHLSTTKVKHKKKLTSNYWGWLKESRLRQGSFVRRGLGWCEVEGLPPWRVAPGWVRCNWAGHGIFYLSNSSRVGKEMSKDCIPCSCTSPLAALKLNQVTRHKPNKFKGQPEVKK